MQFVVRAIPVEETYDLRHAILHPEQPRSFSSYAGDRHATTWHAGAFLDGEQIGIASIYREAPPDRQNDCAWRLRDMGVLTHVRRHGCGTALLEACLAHIASHRGTMFWCYARANAVPFYLAHRFQIDGDVIDLPGFGPRVIMSRPLAVHGP